MLAFGRPAIDAMGSFLRVKLRLSRNMAGQLRNTSMGPKRTRYSRGFSQQLVGSESPGAREGAYRSAWRSTLRNPHCRMFGNVPILLQLSQWEQHVHRTLRTSLLTQHRKVYKPLRLRHLLERSQGVRWRSCLSLLHSNIVLNSAHWRKNEPSNTGELSALLHYRC